jgi:hypothetical protein
MKRLDRHTVKAVELTAPGACKRDAGRLHSEIRKGRVFCAFTEAEREVIREELRAVSVDRLIPSLFSFFEDVRYLRGPAACVRRLICGSGDDYAPQTLRQSFSGERQTENTWILTLWLPVCWMTFFVFLARRIGGYVSSWQANKASEPTPDAIAHVRQYP